MKALFVAAWMVSTAAWAAWPGDAGEDVLVGGSIQTQFSLVPDGQGGTYVVWTDMGAWTGSSYPARLRAAHFASDGTRLWPSSGGQDLLGMDIGGNNFSFVQAVTDETGGFIAVYVPAATTRPFAQHVGPDAGLLWPQTSYGGVPFATAGGYWLELLPDGAGGALAEYQDTSNGLVFQGVSSTGTLSPSSGLSLGGGVQSEYRYASLDMAADGDGGVYTVWNTSLGGSQAAVTHVLASGSLGFLYEPQASAGGQSRIGSSGSSGSPPWSLAAQPGIPGPWVTWSDGSAIELQHFEEDGGVSLDGGTLVDGGTPFGRIVAPLNSSPYPPPTVVSDGDGGTVVLWCDTQGQPDAGTTQLFASRFGPTGAPLWPAQPLALTRSGTSPFCGSVLPTFRAFPTTDGAFLVFWIGNGTAPAQNLLADKLRLADGALIWGDVLVSNHLVNDPNGDWLQAVVDADNGATVAFNEGNSIYLKHVFPDGSLSGSAVSSAPDGGTPDAGMPDGGTPDAGTGTGQDAGTSPVGTPAPSHSGCSSSGAGGAVAELLVLAGALLLTRRRSRAR